MTAPYTSTLDWIADYVTAQDRAIRSIAWSRSDRLRRRTLAIGSGPGTTRVP